jgi:hypothetical protein
MQDTQWIDWLLLVLALTSGVILLGFIARTYQLALNGSAPHYRIKTLLALTAGLCLIAAAARKYPPVLVVIGFPLILVSFIWVLSALLGRPSGADDSFPSDDNLPQ